MKEPIDFERIETVSGGTIADGYYFKWRSEMPGGPIAPGMSGPYADEHEALSAARRKEEELFPDGTYGSFHFTIYTYTSGEYTEIMHL